MTCNCGKPTGWGRSMCKSCESVFSDLSSSKDPFIDLNHVLWIHQLLSRQELDEFYNQRIKISNIVLTILVLVTIFLGTLLVYQIFKLY